MSKEKNEAIHHAPDQPAEISESRLAEVAGGLDVNGQGGGDNRVLLGNRGNDFNQLLIGGDGADV